MRTYIIYGDKNTFTKKQRKVLRQVCRVVEKNIESKKKSFWVSYFPEIGGRVYIKDDRQLINVATFKPSKYGFLQVTFSDGFVEIVNPFYKNLF